MALEAVNGAGMTYQGSGSTAKATTKSSEQSNSSPEMSKETIAMEKNIANITPISEKTKRDEKGEGKGQEATQQPLGQNAQIKKAVEELNRQQTAKNAQSEAIFGIHDATNRVTIKIVDKKTKEVLKEYPPEKTLDMIAKVWEAAGIMVDEKL